MIWFFFILQMSLKHALLKNKKTKHWKTNAHLTRKCAQIHTMVGVGSRDFCQGYSQEISLGWDFNLRKDLKTKCTGVAYCSYGKSNSVHDWNYFSTLEDFLKGLKLINLGRMWSERGVIASWVNLLFYPVKSWQFARIKIHWQKYTCFE